MNDQPQRDETFTPTAEELALDKHNHDEWMRAKVEEALKTFNFAHYVNFDIRIDGENRPMEGDWVKPVLKRFLELLDESTSTWQPVTERLSWDDPRLVDDPNHGRNCGYCEGAVPAGHKSNHGPGFCIPPSKS